jgi:two-component system sensor histidine kinase PilS (NtrC family)
VTTTAAAVTTTDRNGQPGSLPPPVATADEDTDSIMRRRLSWLMGGRLFVVTLLLGGTVFIGAELRGTVDSFTPTLLISFIVATYALSLVLAVWLPRTKSLILVAAVQLGWDIVLSTSLVFVSGGVASGFTFLYGIAILMAALIVGPRATQATAVATLILYTVLGVSVANGWVPHPPDQPAERYILDPEATGYAIVTNIVGLLLVTILASNLATRVRRTGAQLAQATESAASLARLNDDIVRSLTGGLITADVEGNVVAVNPAGAAIFGAEADALVGKAVSTLLPVEVHPPPPNTDVARGEGEASRPDGTTFPVGFTKNALVDAHGTVAGTLIMFQDLTELRALRDAAQRSERLAALGRLATGLAHEIRNPLSSISGSVQLIRESSALGNEDRRLLGIVLTEVRRLDDLVSTMLHVGRPSPPKRTTHDLRSLITDVVQVAQLGTASLVGVDIALEAPDPVEADIDAGQVRQVVWNLLKNALQVSPRGSTVHVAVRDSAGQVEIEVRDEGGGIPAEVEARLFETFFSNRAHGVGLGLALVRQIVDAHGGEIDVDNRPGEGATFRVRFDGPSSP